jgi:hypothetical protein
MSMQILFEKTHPKDLVEALKLVHQTDDAKTFLLSYYDKTIDDSKLKQPILLMFDYNKKGLEPTTEELYKLGFRIFAMKTKREEKLDFFKLSLTVLGMWPKIIDTVKEDNSPFICTYKYGGHKLTKIK